MDEDNGYTRGMFKNFQPFVDAFLEQLDKADESTIKVELYETDPTEWMDDVLCAEIIE